MKIIAECGVTCNYDMAMTKDLIDVARDAGADIIKFIFWSPEEIMADRTEQITYDTMNGPKTENLYDMLDKMRFTINEWEEIKEYCHGIKLMATVNSYSGAELAYKLNLDAIKISSWDYNNPFLKEQINTFRNDFYLDVGPVSIADLSQLTVYADYLMWPYKENLKSIPYLEKVFHMPAGFSSPDRDTSVDFVAVGLGAHAIEKRLTMNRSLPGLDHFRSLEPLEFVRWVKDLREIDLGLECLKPPWKHREKYFRHLVADKDLKEGTFIKESDITAKRPESGINPKNYHFFIGRKLTKNLKENEALTWDCV